VGAQLVKKRRSKQEPSGWPKGLIENVAISIAIANYGGNFAQYHDGQKGNLRIKAAVIITNVKRASVDDQSGADQLIEKVANIVATVGRATYWRSVAKRIIDDVRRAPWAPPPPIGLPSAGGKR
jgi:hypothetical protein